MTSPATLYKEFLVSRIFKMNGFVDADALLSEIQRARDIPLDQWQWRGYAFEQISQICPMNNDGIGGSLRLEDVPDFVNAEARAFEEFVLQNPDLLPSGSGLSHKMF